MPSHALITLARVLCRSAEQMRDTVLSPYVWIMIYKQPMWGASVGEIKVKHLREQSVQQQSQLQKSRAWVLDR